MTNINTLQEFFSTQVIQASIFGYIFNLALAAILSFWLGRFYVKYGLTLSNRSTFSRNFVMVTLTTMLVITIVKSSLALSLGLIGALSIVRFRAAIKEPEELSYLFLAIAIGLGLGANQRFFTIISVAFIIGVFYLHFKLKRTDNTKWEQNVYLTILTENPDILNMEMINNILKKHCSMFKLRRMDKSGEMMEIIYIIELFEIDVLRTIESDLRKIDNKTKVIFTDSK